MREVFTTKPPLKRKNRMGNFKYLEVIFYDNDFSFALREAVEYLYNWVKWNNTHLTPKRTVSEYFMILFENEVLEDCIKHVAILKNMQQASEFLTRDLKRKPSHQDITYISDPEKITQNLQHLMNWFKVGKKGEGPRVAFHTDDAFLKEDQNGEHVCLEFSTGKIWTF